MNIIGAATMAHRSWLQNYVISHLHMDGADAAIAFSDPKRAWTAQGNAQIDTAQSKFGGASGLFDGTGDWLKTINSNDFQFGTGKFAIRLHVRFNATSGIQNFLGFSTVGGAVQFLLNSGSLDIYGETGFVIQRAWAPSTGQWYCLLFDRNGDSWREVVDAAQLGATVTDGRSLGSPNHANGIGIAAEVTAPSQFVNAWLDEVVILKGANFDNDDAPTLPFADF